METEILEETAEYVVVKTWTEVMGKRIPLYHKHTKIPWNGEAWIDFNDGTTIKLNGVKLITWKRGDIIDGKVVKRVIYDEIPPGMPLDGDGGAAALPSVQLDRAMEEALVSKQKSNGNQTKLAQLIMNVKERL